MNVVPARRFRGSVFLVAALLFGVFSISPAVAEGNGEWEANPVVAHQEALGQSRELTDPQPEPATIQTSSGGQITVQAARYTVICTPTAQNAHGSSGAAAKGKYYIIAKVRVSCNGTGAYPSSVTIQVWSSLLWNPAKSKSDPLALKGQWSSLASAKESRTVKVNGKVNTFYVPEEGKTGGTKTGLYQLSTTVTITHPAGQKIGRDLSGVMVCKVTTSSARCTN